MNRFLVTAAILTISAISFTSCKKCTECTVFDKYGNVDSALEDIETCGNKTEVDDAEQLAADYAVAIQGTYECIRE